MVAAENLVGMGGGVVNRERPQTQDQDHDYIQSVCALILVLVQSSVVMPYQSDDDAPPEEGDANAYSKELTTRGRTTRRCWPRRP